MSFINISTDLSTYFSIDFLKNPLFTISLIFDIPRYFLKSIKDRYVGAGRENRTPVSSLARTCSTTKPYPQNYDYPIEMREVF